MNKLQAFTADGTFNVPAGVSCVFVTMIGGGGGGEGWPGVSGGAAGICIRAPVNVTPGGTLAITVGQKGLGSASGAYTNTDGTDSVVGSFRAGGGFAAYAQDDNPSFPRPGVGGGCSPGFGGTADGVLAPRTFEEPTLPINGGHNGVCWWGGSSGGAADGGDGYLGGPAVNNHAGGSNGGTMSGTGSGAGGASSFFGTGPRGGRGPAFPTGDDNNGEDASSTAYGAGGAGGANAGRGGNAAGGVVWVEWVRP